MIARHFKAHTLIPYGLVISAVLSCTDQQRPNTANPANARSGEQIFKQQCSTCHQQNGGGLTGVYPPLSRSEWVLGDASLALRIIEHGLMGSITVLGEDYQNVMAPQGHQLSDEELHNILNHIRTSFGNTATLVTLEEVKMLRQKYKDRRKMWTAKELLSSNPQ